MVHEQDNEISDVENESVRETDEETAESENVEQQFQPDAAAPKSHRKPKNLGNVMMVYPNVMSGLPKTTPKNMPETNEMMLYDQEGGMDLHVVFSQPTTSQPPEVVSTSTTEQTDSEDDLTTKKPRFNFAKRRRQYRPIKPTSEAPTEDEETKPTTVRPRSAARQRNTTRNFTVRPTTVESTTSATKRKPVESRTRPSKTEDEEILVTSEDDNSPPNRFRLFNARRKLNYLRKSTAATTEAPFEVTPPILPTKRIPSRPTPQSKTPEKKNRLPNVRENTPKIRINRLLRKNVTSAVATDAELGDKIPNLSATTAAIEDLTTEIPHPLVAPDTVDQVKEAKNPSSVTINRRPSKVNVAAGTGDQAKRVRNPSRITMNRRPSKINVAPDTRDQVEEVENLPRVTNNRRPSKMNETFIKAVDTNHRNTISKVRDALTVATIENRVAEIPRSFASADMNNRVKKIENLLVEEMVSAYTETKAKRRGSKIHLTTEPTTSAQTSKSTRPFRGNKKFQLSDLLVNTPVVPMSLKRTMRVRSTTASREEDVVVTTVRPRRRRPTTTVPATTEESSVRDENPEGRNFRRRLNVQRRINAESTTSTTPFTRLIDATTESVTQSTNPTLTTTPTTTVETTTAPEITTFSEETVTLIETTPSSYESEEDLEKESTNEELSKAVNTDEPQILSEKSDSPSDFKPSPLWSISVDGDDDGEEDDDEEPNHSYDMSADERERVLRTGQRRPSRDVFYPPENYLNEFVPIGSPRIVGPIPKSSKSGDDAKLRYNLPRDSKVEFSRN